MATFHHITPPPSVLASRQLHPAASPERPTAHEVLVEIAAGLARTVTASEVGPGRAVLLTTSAYEVTIEAIEVGGCQVVDGAQGQPVSVAVVAGRLVAWTVEDRSHLLSPGGLCSLAGGEQVQLVNVGTDRAVLVSARARAADDQAGTSAFAPCSSLVA